MDREGRSRLSARQVLKIIQDRIRLLSRFVRAFDRQEQRRIDPGTGALGPHQSSDWKPSERILVAHIQRPFGNGRLHPSGKLEAASST